MTAPRNGVLQTTKAVSRSKALQKPGLFRRGAPSASLSAGFTRTFATANPSFRGRDARTQAGKLRPTSTVLVVPPVSQLPPSQGYGVTGRRDLALRLRWGSRFCGFAGFRWCAACRRAARKIFIRSGENVVFDE